MKYAKEAKFVWQNYVPERGQADTVQGELLRAIEKLRDEAQRNGNINWDNGHVILVDYIQEKLSNSDIFDSDAKQEINEDIRRIKEYTSPETNDEMWDRLSDRIMEWYLNNKEPIPHQHNPELKR